MLAEAERHTPAPSATLYARTLPGDARRGLHGGRRVPLPRARHRVRRRGGGRARRGSASCACTSRTRRGGLDRMRQPSVAAYLAEVEALRDRGIAVGVAPHSVRACPRDWLEEIGRYAEAEGLVAPRPRGRAAARDRGVPRRARLPPDRAARARGLPRRADDRRPRDARQRRRARPAPRQRRAICACPTTEADLGRRLPPRRARAPSRHPALHRLRFERPDRPVRGAARARGHRAATGAAGAACFSTDELWEIGGDTARASLGLDARRRRSKSTSTHPLARRCRAGAPRGPRSSPGAPPTSSSPPG